VISEVGVRLYVSFAQAWSWWNRVAGYKKIYYGMVESHFMISFSFTPGILAANIAVYCMWWIPRIQRFMKLYFQAMPDKSKSDASFHIYFLFM